jgi:hypothetical protein
MALIGLATVGLAISAAVLLVVSVVDRGAPVPVIGAATAANFAVLWFAFPLAHRRAAPPASTQPGSAAVGDRGLRTEEEESR